MSKQQTMSVAEYQGFLEMAIQNWRAEVRKPVDADRPGGVSLESARCYVDAFQSAYAILFGEPLPSEEMDA